MLLSSKIKNIALDIYKILIVQNIEDLFSKYVIRFYFFHQSNIL